MTSVVCPGCGLVHESSGLPPAGDLDATGECVREYGMVAASFYSTSSLVGKRQYVVDAYACQHPSVLSRRSVQTTALSLMTLDLVLSVGIDVELGSRLHGQMMQTRPHVFEPLPRPDFSGTLTHRHLTRLAERPRLLEGAAREWAESVWQAWQVDHAQVRRWNRLLVPDWLAPDGTT